MCLERRFILLLASLWFAAQPPDAVAQPGAPGALRRAIEAGVRCIDHGQRSTRPPRS